MINSLRNIQIAMYILLLGALSACGQLNEGSSNAVVNTGTNSSTGNASVNAALYFKVDMAWEITPALKINVLSNCTIPIGSAAGTSTTCSLELPEGQLHFSALTMTVGSAGSSRCKQLIYEPYGYQASDDAGFVPPIAGAAAIDCSVASPPIGCFDGPATVLFSDYPATAGRYITLSENREMEFTHPSANSLKKKYNTYIANWMTNPAIDHTVGASTYLASTLQDYSVTCIDEYAEVIYRIDLYLRSVPYLTPGVVDYAGWN